MKIGRIVDLRDHIFSLCRAGRVCSLVPSLWGCIELGFAHGRETEGGFEPSWLRLRGWDGSGEIALCASSSPFLLSGSAPSLEETRALFRLGSLSCPTVGKGTWAFNAARAVARANKYQSI
jgi:hypothetical protein